MLYLYGIWIFNFSINIVAFLFHIIAMYVLISCKHKTNQLVILINLSITEIFFILRNATNNMVRLLRYKKNVPTDHHSLIIILKNIHPGAYDQANSFTFFTLSAQLVLIMVTLTLDRLVCAQKPIWYVLHMKILVVVRILGGCWCFSIIVGVFYSICLSYRTSFLAMFSCIGIIYFLFAVLTYIIIGFKIRTSDRRFSTANQRNQSSKVKFKKYYMVPGLIMLTYFLFYAIPFLIVRFWINERALSKADVVLSATLNIVMDLGIISDVLVFILLTPHYRELLHRRFLFYRRKKMTLTRHGCRNSHIAVNNSKGVIRKVAVVSLMSE